MVPGAGIEPARLAAANFKSATSTDFVTRANATDDSRCVDADEAREECLWLSQWHVMAALK